jgi:hypothetical protein
VCLGVLLRAGHGDTVGGCRIHQRLLLFMARAFTVRC